MPCVKCKSDFNFFNWKIKCGECTDKYCNKCLKRKEGVLYCEKCMVLLKRPPDRTKLMELKSKDLQDYLNKRHISTYGIVEKQELVDLFCDKLIPEKPKRGVEKLTANFAGSVPNLRPLNELWENLESVITSDSRSTRQPRTPPDQSRPPPQQPRPPPPSRPHSPPNHWSSDNPTYSTHSSPTTSNGQGSQNLGVQEETANESPSPPKYPKLQDIGSVEELHNLSSKDLKILLTLYRVDFKGCVEKSELLERAERLWEDNNEQSKEIPENMPVQELCKLCMDAPLDCVLLECGHIATCTDCGKKLAECPICRQYVVRVVRIFKA